MSKIFITGGAGFIGSNAARYFSDLGYDVVVYDNLSRLGCKFNLDWLKPDDITLVEGDLREREKLDQSIKAHKPDVVLHLAGQVAVTTSVVNPMEDYEINATGSMNLLEAVRVHSPDSFIIYASTNKVYGGMEEIAIVREGNKYTYKDYPEGISESWPMDFHSPYGCSKGAADQYMRDYFRIYNIPTVVLRQSCIYGYRQFGVEDQGWLSWFIIACHLKKEITIYGDGMQVRDVLFIDDLLKLYEQCIRQKDIVKGQIYNVGGGNVHSLSLLELISMLESISGEKMKVEYDDWRPGDQKVYVSDISRLREVLNWVPDVDPSGGVRKLYNWVGENTDLFRKLFP